MALRPLAPSTASIEARAPRNSVRQARRASRRHAVEHRADARREHGEPRRPATACRRNDTLAVGQVLSIPGTTTLASTDADAVGTRSTTYVVRRGDTLSRIANKFRVRLSDLLGWNDLNSRSVIKPGQRLVMYVAIVARESDSDALRDIVRARARCDPLPTPIASHYTAGPLRRSSPWDFSPANVP